MSTRHWQVQEAKADLSGLIRAAEDAPQTITRNGKAVAVVVSQRDFDRLRRTDRSRRGNLLEFFAGWPPLEIPPRDRADAGHEIDL
jgi:prevent-host-death family protein